MTKTFLIIDNQAFLYRPKQIEEAFAEAGVTAEFRATDWKLEALDIIREWKERGLKLDVITCDINATGGNSGVGFLENILDGVAAEIGTDMLPQQLFLHSASHDHDPVATRYGISPRVIYCGELFRLRNDQGVYYDESHTNSRAVRDYLNANWGTRFVMSKAEEKNLDDPNGSLDPEEIADLLYHEGITPEQALQRIKLIAVDSFIPGPYIEKPSNFDNEPCELRFSRGVSGTVAGSAAYTTEDILHIKSLFSQEPIILILNTAENYETPPRDINGLVVLQDDDHAAHIKQVCENMGVPTLIGAKRDGFGDDYQFSMEDGLSFSQYHDRRKSGSIKAGSGLTMEAYGGGGRLYAGKFPIRYHGENYHINSYIEIVDVAASNLQKNVLSIKANADTPDQVDYAIGNGADGIGLVRSEHMFFEPEKKIVLRRAFLDFGSSGSNLESISAFHDVQYADFREIFEIAHTANRNFPVTVRLLDAPPIEFMSATEAALFEARVGKGNMRGVQAGLRISGLYEAQISALCEAHEAVKFQHPLHILVPNVLSEDEMDQVREMFNRYASGTTGITLGPMVETKPYLAQLISLPQIPYGYVSYGTNDLTSDLMDGIMRNDTPRIIEWMKGHGIHGENPFLSLMDPVKAEILRLQTRQNAPQATICGQQVADDERSIRWAVKNGINLSVPFRYVPYAKLVAGQELLLNAIPA